MPGEPVIQCAKNCLPALPARRSACLTMIYAPACVHIPPPKMPLTYSPPTHSSVCPPHQPHEPQQLVASVQHANNRITHQPLTLLRCCPRPTPAVRPYPRSSTPSAVPLPFPFPSSAYLTSKVSIPNSATLTRSAQFCTTRPPADFRDG